MKMKTTLFPLISRYAVLVKKIPPMKFYYHETKEDFIRVLISLLWDRIHAIDEEIKKL